MLDYMMKTFSSLPILKENLKVGLCDYLTEQLQWCKDPSFSSRFPFQETGLPQQFFQQKIIRSSGADYLTGPRYLGGDIHQPFIELVASSAPLTAEAAHHIFDAWQPLGANTIRELRQLKTHTTGQVDQQIYSRHVSTPSLTSISPDNEVTVVPAHAFNIKWCMNAIESAYSETLRQQPGLKKVLAPADEEDIREAIDSSELYIIQHNRIAVGLIAISAQRKGFVEGYWITEEIIIPESRGLGLAAKAQVALCRILENKPGPALLLGTITQQNTASVRTAQRAGRQPILEYAFLSREHFNA